MSNLLHVHLSQLSAILFLAAILKMAEFQVARDQNLMCVMKRTYGENFMLVSSTEVFPQNLSLSRSTIYPNHMHVLSVND